MSEIQIGVSACLLGEQIRYDGGHKRNALLLDEMASHVSFVPVRRELAMFTPLFLVLIAIGTYILVALDSIPAVFGVTDEPFIVFVANAFALLGLRGPNFLVTGLLDRLVYLSTGLSIVLGFIGIKLVLHWGHPHDDRVPEIATTTTSLAVIGAVLLVTTVASVIKARRHPTARAPCRVAARPLRALRRRAARRSRSTPRSSTRTHS